MSQPSQLDVGLTASDPTWTVDRERIVHLLQYAAAQESTAGELGVWVCRDDEIADLHQRFMGIAGPTDVMSFPGEGGYLGDIAVSYDTAGQQALDAGHPLNRELAYLALHGLLHLVGYDDIEPRDRDRMMARQDQLMAAFEQGSPGVWN